MRMDSSEANFARVSATILTAHAQGKALKVWQQGCRPDGVIHFTAAWLDR
jgi:hypothetical protein